MFPSQPILPDEDNDGRRPRKRAETPVRQRATSAHPEEAQAVVVYHKAKGGYLGGQDII